MDSKYTTEMKNADALAFTRSRFGRHYLKRLQRAFDTADEKSRDMEYTDSYRLHCSDVAATVKKELDYFSLHREYAKENSVFSRLLKKKEKPIEI